MKSAGRFKDRAAEAFLLSRCVTIEYVEGGPRYSAASGDKRMGQRGQLIATVGLKHAQGYVAVLKLDSGKLDCFNPMGLFPETQQQAGDAGASQDRAAAALLLARCVDVEYADNGSRYVAASGDKRVGQRGRLVATVGLKHGGGHVVVLQLDNGKLDSFNPFGLFPETQQIAA